MRRSLCVVIFIAAVMAGNCQGQQVEMGSTEQSVQALLGAPLARVACDEACTLMYRECLVKLKDDQVVAVDTSFRWPEPEPRGTAADRSVPRVRKALVHPSASKAANHQSADSRAPLRAVSSPTPTASHGVAENGDRYNQDNDGDGRREPVHVRGYYRKDGTYVRSHYRAK